MFLPTLEETLVFAIHFVLLILAIGMRFALRNALVQLRIISAGLICIFDD